MSNHAITGIGSHAADIMTAARRIAAAVNPEAGFALPAAPTLPATDHNAIPVALQRPAPAMPLTFTAPATAPSGHVAAAGTDPVTAKALRSFEGATWVGRLPGNGGRDVSILVPPGIDPQKPVEVLVLFPGVFRGRNATQVMMQDPSLNIRQALNQLGKERNTVIVLPTMAYNGQEMKANGMNDEDAGQLQQQAVAQIQQQWGLKPGTMTAVGYSYGGQPLMNAAESGRLQPGTRILALDATYTWKSTGSIAKRLGTAVQGRYDLHNFHHPGRSTLAVPAGTGTNHLVTGDHGQLPRQLPQFLRQAFAP